jgi:regulator of sirC expression with transglutaminase-like and TPR domain
LNHETRRRDLATCVRRNASPSALADAAWLIAQGEYPELDVAAGTGRLIVLGERVRARLADEGGRPWRVLHGVLGQEEDFTGDEATYGHPDNSYLNRVLERKRGLPILLSVIWVAVAHAAGIPAAGIGLPGHFIARVGEGNEEAFIDPFRRGLPVSRDEALRLGAAAAGGAPADPAWLQPQAAGDVAFRILTNLSNAYDRSGDAARLERVLSDQLALQPREGRLLVRRGDVRATLGDTTGALLDLNEALIALEDGPLFKHAHGLATRLARSRISEN